MENHPSQSVASALSHQLIELSLWIDQNSFSYLHSLDCDWPSTRAISVLLSRDIGPVRIESSAREDTPAACRVFYLARRICKCRFGFGALGTDSITATATGRERCCWLCGTIIYQDSLSCVMEYFDRCSSIVGLRPLRRKPARFG